MWINALGFVPSKNARVCGKHFISGKELEHVCMCVKCTGWFIFIGKPSKDEKNVDYVPTVLERQN